ncbi:ATP-binding cassette domain-containing protein [Deinococcus malanensis]
MSTLLSAQALAVTFGERPVLSGVSLSVMTGERVALLGRNGAGKTTLLRILTGELRPEDGEVWRSEDLRLSVLSQQHAHPAGLSVRALIDASHPYRELETELLALEANLGDPQTLASWTGLHARLEQAEAYAWPSRVRRILGMLDLTRFLTREAATLSGGERTRLALALALAREPDLLILDEPTNHLDIRMREWLEGWLRGFPGGVLLTSHDRDFLDAVATRSLWLENGEATPYPGATAGPGPSANWSAAPRPARTAWENARLAGCRAAWNGWTAGGDDPRPSKPAPNG